MLKHSLMAASAAVVMSAGVVGGGAALSQGPELQPINSSASPTKGEANKTAGVKKQAAAVRSGRSGTWGNRYPAPGWSVAQDRRNARKRRNVLRNRASRKG